MEDVLPDTDSKVTLISEEIGNGYTISRYSVTSTIPAGKYVTGETQFNLAVNDYIRVDLSFSPTPTGTIKVGGYNLTDGLFYCASTTSSSYTKNLRIKVDGTYLFRVYNTSSDSIEMTGTFELLSFSGGVSLDITPIEADGDNWCWAACIQMFAKYLGYDVTQSAIVTKVKGGIVYDGGDADDYLNGMLFATNYTYEAIREDNTLTISEIKDILSSDLPLGISLKYERDGETISHGVVVTAVSSSNTYIRINDPNSNTPVVYKFSSITSSSAEKKYSATTKIQKI
ncbi:MAG: C39 family peptidase [Oscillospiraceae bacterium]|nr:C39 family peptidase [Oscillospiraceae bacterium]